LSRKSLRLETQIYKEPIMNTSVVLITGGLTGIGRAAAVAFAKKGAKVVLAGRRDEAGKELVKELRSFGGEAEPINADVRKEDDVRNMVDKTVARFGRIDIAVNNAATEGAVGPIRTGPRKASPRRSKPMLWAWSSA
jgi:NAD(P)-dependent dehydrogenase (short-subunit alcohol dehydrogenase family)